jgi:deoxyribodipyrimidine photolyase
VALNLLDRYIHDKEYISRFEKPKTSPADFEPQSTTLLSPHLHFRSLSVRKFWWDVQLVLEKRRQNKKSSSSIPANLLASCSFITCFLERKPPSVTNSRRHIKTTLSGLLIGTCLPISLQLAFLMELIPSSLKR